jgi:son of sevenless-like protein
VSKRPFQIYYANTLTGKRSRDLPRDSDSDASHNGLGGLNAFQANSRSVSGDGLRLATVNDPIDFPRDLPVRTDPVWINGTAPLSIPALHVNDIPRTPVKPLPLPLQPGMTPPRPRANTDLASSNRDSNRVPGVLFDSLTAQLRHRSYSTSDPSRLSLHQRSISESSERHSSYSNTHHFSLAREASRLRESTLVPDIPDVQEPPCAESPPPSAPTILQSLTPPAPELVSELSQRAQQCIHSVILYLRQFGIPQVAEDEEIVDNLICAAITAVRDLLYVSGPSFRRVGGRNTADRGASNASQTPLVPAQRRAVATLSKFVLSARAVLNDGPWIATDDVSQLSSDAEELERSVVEFVSIAQGVRGPEVVGPRRLHGYLTAPHADPAKAGAGTAGTWKGFGWVDIEDDEEAPCRNLNAVTFNELVNHISRVQERLCTLTGVLRATRPGI